MIKRTEKKLVVGLEIGTSKIITLIGEILPDSMINIIGIGNCQSRGMEKGSITNLDLVVTCIQQAIDQAELMANCRISSLYLAISGKYIQYQNEIGMVPIVEEVTLEDLENVVHIAKSVKVCDEHRILHVIPQEYSIDNQDGIKYPVGLSGVRMQAKVHIITCHNDMVKNVVKAVERCGITVDKLIFSGLASSYAVITEDERELGVCVVDIGGGTMDMTIYTAGALRHSKVIPYAGHTVTRDISYAFNIPILDAEFIKIQYGCAFRAMVNKEEQLEIPSMGGRPTRNLQRQNLVEVIEARYSELLHLINDEILRLQDQLRKNGITHHLSAGIILTGGASKIEGILNNAQKVFNNQVRIGYPINISDLTDYIKGPCYSTAVGLLQYGKEIRFHGEKKLEKNPFFSAFLRKIRNWIRKDGHFIMLLL
ncbi:cell division protein FtsA [Candidatus Schneideria nysicola]|uniref:cell division protein FtsA n=1 Tax=Candidatus Schneideria nysicola TaxID=1081631 RepID=UPI001CAA77CD|nr:cell division protein FtsA [Candidatus Schneideria nysicola]UAJ66190.1 cell division protein FtsA [Candidatus Schneideria nysicola]